MRARQESGYTLIELTVSMTVMLIVVAMTYMIGAQVVKTAVHGTINGQAAETAQTQVSQLEQYLQDAVIPNSLLTEYPTISNLCSGGPSSTSAVQAAYDFQLELCTSPSRAASCTSGLASTPNSACPQLYLISVNSSSCSTAFDRCTLQVQDESVTVSGSHPVVWSLASFRCTSTCRGDLGNGAGNEEASGVSPLFTYYNGTTQVTGATVSSVKSVKLDLQNLSSPAKPSGTNEIYTEISDTVFLTGAATPSA